MRERTPLDDDVESSIELRSAKESRGIQALPELDGEFQEWKVFFGDVLEMI